jgi:hypothetical protein
MRKIACVCLAATMAAFSSAAQADHLACGSRDDVLAQLAAKFKEAPIAAGLANNGGIVEVVRSINGATWTITVTMPNGVTCLVAAGEGWKDLKDVVFPGADLPL